MRAILLGGAALVLARCQMPLRQAAADTLSFSVPTVVAFSNIPGPANIGFLTGPWHPFLIACLFAIGASEQIFGAE
jgi:hypothetical protein